MTSLNEQVNCLHAAFCQVTARNLAMNPCFERWWHCSLQYGVTPEMVREVMQSRIRRQYASADMRLYCLSLRHCIGDEDRLAQFVDEAAALEAMKRKKVFTPGKAQALRDTGRPGEPDPSPARRVDEIFAEMRKAT